ncbi:MAG: hypothetical protein OXC55_00965 [Chloroflexi bacterium]|nr:hypothetical protein [Chloroflexota bacterium]
MSESKPGQERYTEEEWQTIMDGLDEEEREIMAAFEKGEMVPSRDADEQSKAARMAARNALRRHHRVSLRLSDSDMKTARHLAEEKNMPCSTLLYEIVREYLRGRLIERRSIFEDDPTFTLPSPR